MPRLVMHIGDCKSGSTAIQSVLRQGSWTQNGPRTVKLHYAQGGRRDGLNHHRLSNSLTPGSEAAQIRDQAWARLGQEMQSSDADVMVISSERFEFAAPEEAMAALKQHVPQALDDLAIIAYVRPHAARLLSGYAQNVKQGLYHGTLDAFAEESDQKGRFHYADRLLNWRRVFGSERITLRPMIRDRLQAGCVVTDFLNFALGDDAISAHVENIPNPNRSLSGQQLEMLVRLHARLKQINPTPDPMKQRIIGRLALRLEQGDLMVGTDPAPVALTPTLVDRLEALFGADADRCDTELFDEPVMRQALQTAAAKPVPASGSTALRDEVDSLRDLSIAWLDVVMMVAQNIQQQANQGGGRKQRGGGGAGRPHIISSNPNPTPQTH